MELNTYDISNKVDGKTVYYWINQQNQQIPNDAGFVGIVNSTTITVRDLKLTNNYQGVLLAYTNKSRIENINTSNDYFGIHLAYSSNNTVTNNNASDSWGGIYLSFSSSNKIYLNNFINNTNSAYSYSSTNIWNSAEEITYVYNGTAHTNYTGNYWDDYNGTDDNKDGIGDTPYSIDSDNDTYPLMLPFEDYFMPTGNVFDTGEPANPYPSIMGTHNGTITPNQTITVSKLYTYPCPGTGGHTESIKLYENDALIANGTWNGYQSDYPNITIHNRTGAPYVTLLENHKYNYTIRTGSYPQIYHNNKTLTVLGGEITCTKFTDANGRVYYDWIPAIRLFR